MKIIYHDLDRSAARIRWQGVGFLDGVPTEFPDAFRSKVDGNPFFEIVDEEPSAPEEPVKQTLHLPSKPKG